MCVCVSVCVCKKERKYMDVCGCVWMCVDVCVCVSERERERVCGCVFNSQEIFDKWNVKTRYFIVL